MYKSVLFDLDGTLVNTYQGIYNSYQYALRKMKIEFSGKELVNEAIGAPLLSVFKEKFSLCEMDALQAVEHYREYYSRKGKLEVITYEGIKETLIKLQKQNYLLAVATLKRESFAKEILKNLELDQYFELIYGMNEDDSLSKADLIEKCLDKLQIENSEAILVGDSIYDQIGAKEANIDFLAVTYGFGFKTALELKKIREANILTVNSGYDIPSALQ